MYNADDGDGLTFSIGQQPSNPTPSSTIEGSAEQPESADLLVFDFITNNYRATVLF